MNRYQSDDVHNLQKEWISCARIPPNMAYRAGLSRCDRLWLELLHAGFSVGQVRKWDHGDDRPLCVELAAAVPEMLTARTSPSLQTGYLMMMGNAYVEACGMDNAAQPAEAEAANLAGAANGF